MLELAASPDFPSRVAEFYRRRGYTVHENVKVRGASERVYPMRLVAEGGLGALAVSFGDAGGVDEHEVVLIRGLAKDIGATPVLACPSPDGLLRRMAAQMAVVLVDEEALQEPAPPTSAQVLRTEMESHPWPNSGRKESPAPWPSGPSRAIEVEEWIEALTKPKVPATPAPAAEVTPLSSAEELLVDAPAVLEPLVPSTTPLASIPAGPASSFDWLNAPTPAATSRRDPELVAMEHASTLMAAHPEPGLLEVDLPPLLQTRAAAAEAAYARLVWVKRFAWTGLGVLGVFLFLRYIVGV